MHIHMESLRYMPYLLLCVCVPHDFLYSRIVSIQQYIVFKIVYYRGLNNYRYYFGVPYYTYSLMGPKTLFYVLRPLYCARSR